MIRTFYFRIENIFSSFLFFSWIDYFYRQYKTVRFIIHYRYTVHVTLNNGRKLWNGLYFRFRLFCSVVMLLLMVVKLMLFFFFLTLLNIFLSFKWNESLYIYARSTYLLTDSLTHWLTHLLICPHNALVSHLKLVSGFRAYQ